MSYEIRNLKFSCVGRRRGSVLGGLDSTTQWPDMFVGVGVLEEVTEFRRTGQVGKTILPES